MVHRMDDKVAGVRAQAVKASVRLQQPKDKNCPIINR